MPASDNAYGDALTRVRHRLAFLAAALPPAERLEELAAQVARLSVPERRRWLRRGGLGVVRNPSLGLALVHILAGRAFSFRHREPAEGLYWAWAAVQLAEALSAGKPFRAPLADARAEAWLQLANAQRIAGDLARAEASWRRVDAVLPAGTGDAVLAAEVALLKASLRRWQRRLEEAEKLGWEAVLRSEGLGPDRERAVRARIDLGYTYRLASRFEDAFWITWAAAQRIDPSRDPVNALGIVHNFAHILSDMGCHQHALWLVERNRLLYRRVAGPVLRLRAALFRGRLHHRLGEHERAVQFLEAARCGFRDRGMAYDAARASLDLALVYAELRQARKVKELAVEMYPVFLSQAIPQEAAAALLLFADAAEDYRAPAALIARCIQELEDFERTGRRAPGS
jgi:hypothetical protein